MLTCPADKDKIIFISFNTFDCWQFIPEADLIHYAMNALHNGCINSPAVQCCIAAIIIWHIMVMRTHSAPPQGIAPLLPRARTIADQTTKTRIVSCLQMSSALFSTAQYCPPFTVTFPTPWILQPILQQSRSIAGQQHKKVQCLQPALL